MASSNEDATALAVIAAVWLNTGRDLIVAYPVLGFFSMGVMGGIAGWVFAIEGGLFDHAQMRAHACFVFRRACLGGLLGVALWLAWEGYRPVSVYVGMLAAGLVGAFPVKACSYAHKFIRQFIASKLRMARK